MNKTTLGFIYMVMTAGLPPFCRLPKANHVAQSGAVCSRCTAESKLSPSQAVKQLVPWGKRMLSWAARKCGPDWEMKGSHPF